MDIRKLQLALVPIGTFFLLSFWEAFSQHWTTGSVTLDWETIKALGLKAFGAAVVATILQYRPKPHVQELTQAGEPRMVPSKRAGEASHPSPPTKLI